MHGQCDDVKCIDYMNMIYRITWLCTELSKVYSAPSTFSPKFQEGKTPVIPGMQWQSTSPRNNGGQRPAPPPPHPQPPPLPHTQQHARQQHPGAPTQVSPPGALPLHHRVPPGYHPSSRRSPGPPPPLVINSSVGGGGSAGTSGNRSSSATGSSNSLKSSPIDLVDSPGAGMVPGGGNGMQRGEWSSRL